MAAGKSRVIIIGLLSIGIILIAAGCAKEKNSGDDPIRLSWKVEGENLRITLSAETEGWIAVGFNPSNMMQDANFILAYVSEGELYLRDDFGTWMTSHKDDEGLGGSSDVTGISGDETRGVTTVEFFIPLDSGDEYDQPVVLNENTTVLLAYGKKDDFDSMHSYKSKRTVVFK